jgi:hypothetical protein
VIGVISKTGEAGTVQEFFEIFKTPWEFYVPDHSYEVVIIASDAAPADVQAKLLVVYNSKSTDVDHGKGIAPRNAERKAWLEWNDTEFPVYGNTLTFEPVERNILQIKGKSKVAGLVVKNPRCQTVRLGYDLFEEVAFLLSSGQPAANAQIPTLEIHISLLRSLVVGAGIPLVEVPPVPPEHDFMVCLSHDVDFVGIRQHKGDRTMWGFLYRACFKSVLDAFRKKGTWRRVVQNWQAALSLPLVYLGLKPDFWLEFDRYCEIEKGLGSTFFFLPYKNDAGHALTATPPASRAAKYDVTEVREEVRELVQKGCEVGLHGIDAWLSAKNAHDESMRVKEVTRKTELGIRMHWLFFADNSPKALEDGGLSYDSTFGYNDAAGFRAGTAQVFRPAGAEKLLELPLNIQDTALFYPDRMDLSDEQALQLCKTLIHSVAVFGGVLTINWHTRSLSPERLWGAFYARLLEQIQCYRPWFGTGQEITDWFRARRSVQFESVAVNDCSVRVKLTGAVDQKRTPLAVRMYQPDPIRTDVPGRVFQAEYSDIPWQGEPHLEFDLKVLA